MSTIEYETKIHSTKDKKRTKTGIKTYEYGTINIRDIKLNELIGKKVKIKIEEK